MLWFSLCFRGVKKFLSFGLILATVMWGFALESDADNLPIFFSTDLIAQNPIKFGPRSFQDVQALARYRALKANVRYLEEEKEERTDFRTAGLGRFISGDEVRSVISRKNAQKKKIFLVPSFGEPTSHMRGKNMTVTKMRQGDKIVSMDLMVGETREENIQN